MGWQDAIPLARDGSAAVAPAATPTVVVRPPPATSRPPASRKVDPDALTKQLTGLGYSPSGANGILQNIIRESGGDPTQVGDDGTSLGLFQHHAERKSALEKFAKDQGKAPTDPDVQVAFADQELRTQYPKLRALLTNPGTSASDAEEAFKRIFERPASTGGGGWASAPVVATPDFRFSDYALRNPPGGKNANVVWMRPQDYLDLTPDLGDDPRAGKSYAALKQQLAAGDELQEIPSLEVTADKSGAKVTDMDGRVRARAAADAGVGMIPVSVNQVGDKGSITELEGMNGRLLPWDFQGMQKPAAPQPAEAPDNMLVSGIKGAAAGFGRTVLGGQELVGEGLRGVGLSGPGNWLINDAQRGVQKIATETAADRSAHPIVTGAGELLGGSVAPGGVAGRLGGNALRMAATSGALSGLLEPTTPGQGGFGEQKLLQTGLGAATGAATGMVGNALARVVQPLQKKAAQLLANEGVRLTPGQMAGGAVKAAEDKLTSIPVTGDVIRSGQRRSIEDFNRAAWNRVLQPIGQKIPSDMPMGRPASQYVSARINDAYQAILPNLSLRVDVPFVRDLSQVVTDARGTLPDAQFRQFENIARAQILGKLGPTGTSSDGSVINGIDSMLSSEARGYKGDPLHDNRKLGEAVEDLQATFRNMLERQNPKQAPALRQAREAYANYVRVGKAAASTGTATNEGIFTPAQLNAAVRSSDSTTRKLGYSRGTALLQDLSDAGMAVLPSKVPDSGTAGRMMTGAALGGGAAAALHNPLIPMGMLAGAAPYTSAGMSLLRRYATSAPQTRNALAGIARGLAPALAPAATMMVEPGASPFEQPGPSQ